MQSLVQPLINRICHNNSSQ